MISAQELWERLDGTETVILNEDFLSPADVLYLAKDWSDYFKLEPPLSVSTDEGVFTVWGIERLPKEPMSSDRIVEILDITREYMPHSWSYSEFVHDLRNKGVKIELI